MRERMSFAGRRGGLEDWVLGGSVVLGDFFRESLGLQRERFVGIGTSEEEAESSFSWGRVDCWVRESGVSSSLS